MVNQVEQLKKALEVLGSSYIQQRAYLSSVFGRHADISFDDDMNVDELALQFEDASLGVNNIQPSASVSVSFVEKISRLSALLQSLSGESNANFWTIRALRDDARWATVREKASDCLRQLKS